MPLASFILGLALLLVAAAYVVQPFMRTARPAWRRRGAGEVVSVPGANHQDTLRAIRDLDFDYRTGKIAEDDYGSARERLLLEAAAQLQSEPVPAQRGAEADTEIEAAVQALRHTSGAAVCPRCQTPAVAGDRFCARCGTYLSA